MSAKPQHTRTSQLQSQSSLSTGIIPKQFKGMRFCRECDFLLYPKEQVYDEVNGIARLIFDCRICGRSEKAIEGDEWDHCVYMEDHTAQEAGSMPIGRLRQVDRDIINDPTLMRRNDVTCPNSSCQHTQAVTYTQPTTDRLNLIFVCTKCAYHWKKEALDPSTDIMDESDSD